MLVPNSMTLTTQDMLKGKALNNLIANSTSGLSIVSGVKNVILGHSSANLIDTGSDNVCIGNDNCTGAISASSNVSLGSFCGNGLTTGTHNIFIGTSSNTTVGTASNQIAIGQNAVAEKANEMVLGSSALTIIRNSVNGVCDLGEPTYKFKDAHLQGKIYASHLSLNNIVYVYSTADLPTPAGGFYTLADNYTYIIQQSITLTNGFQFGNNCSLIGVGRGSNITFDETAADIVGIKSTNNPVYVSNITLDGGGGHFANGVVGLINIQNINIGAGAAAYYGRSATITFDRVNIYNPYKLGKIIGTSLVDISNCFVLGGAHIPANPKLTVEGLRVSSPLSFKFRNNMLILFKGAVSTNAGSMLIIDADQLDGSTQIPTLNANIANNFMWGQSIENCIYIDPLSSSLGGNITENNLLQATGGKKLNTGVVITSSYTPVLPATNMGTYTRGVRYSLRKTYAGYGGQCVRLTTTSNGVGGVEQDIGFQADGLMDIFSYSTYANTHGTVYLMKWYNQNTEAGGAAISADLDFTTAGGGSGVLPIFGQFGDTNVPRPKFGATAQNGASWATLTSPAWMRYDSLNYQVLYRRPYGTTTTGAQMAIVGASANTTSSVRLVQEL